ncbi:hypothetical protein H633G_11433 [Metarhizium anisopliae BRIP 53284]|nr:hypothetical protein H633G_11433 [Metarhizium anisopliae BRIP 53284]
MEHVASAGTDIQGIEGRKGAQSDKLRRERRLHGVCKGRLLERMKARGIPDKLVRCVGTFCPDGTPSVVVNGRTSKRRVLAQAGLPQGSSLSPVSFLFFNADLVQRKINANGGSIIRLG